MSLIALKLDYVLSQSIQNIQLPGMESDDRLVKQEAQPLALASDVKWQQDSCDSRLLCLA